ncbi:MAG TPA: hypothetical protein DCR20_02635 [Planctomycetaceae bacterium]|nr:hypothetical protein [Planctomycetaceae bacterium]
MPTDSARAAARRTRSATPAEAAAANGWVSAAAPANPRSFSVTLKRARGAAAWFSGLAGGGLEISASAAAALVSAVSGVAFENTGSGIGGGSGSPITIA